MVSLPVFNASGSEVGKVDVDVDVLCPAINKQLLHDAVVMYQANLRQGSHRTKSRAEVAGSTKKMYRQKGTGNARAGSRRSGVRRGGGHIFARRPRDYSYRLPRKALQLAAKMAFVSRVQDGQLLVVDALDFDSPKTSKMAGVLKSLGVAGRTVGVVSADYDLNLYRSVRNIEGVTLQPAADLNAYTLLRPSCLVFTKSALDSMLARCSGNAS
ncbi:MAG: 50S ribosomal protein L4 [Pirellulaceae bacterium]